MKKGYVEGTSKFFLLKECRNKRQKNNLLVEVTARAESFWQVAVKLKMS
jgi:hypothetical protein